MKTRMLLAAASTLAIAACGGAETDAAELQDQDGAVETLLSEEQPPLEGDNPFADAEAEAEAELAEADAELDAAGQEIEAEADEFATDADRTFDAIGEETGEFAADTERTFDAAGQEIDEETSEFAADLDDAETEADESMATADVAPTVTDGTTAKQYTAENTDAYIAEDGELITGSEAALLAGSYDVVIGEEGQSLPLEIQGEGDLATGTLDGEPIQIAVTGRNFTFDAPVDMDGETSIMTFTGTFMDGMIENGVVEAQGDGSTMTFTAERSGDAFEADTDAGLESDLGSDATLGDTDGYDAGALGEDDAAFETDDLGSDDVTTDAMGDTFESTEFDTGADTGTDMGADEAETDNAYGDARETTDAVRSDVDALEADDVEEADAEDLPYEDGDASSDTMTNTDTSGTSEFYDSGSSYDVETRAGDASAPANTAPLNTVPEAATIDSSRFGDSDADADALTRQLNADDASDASSIGSDEADTDRPSGIMRSGTNELDEPLDARGDTFTEEDSGFADEANDADAVELDEMNREVDGREDAVEPLNTGDDALDEAMDDDPNFDPSF